MYSTLRPFSVPLAALVAAAIAACTSPTAPTPPTCPAGADCAPREVAGRRALAGPDGTPLYVLDARGGGACFVDRRTHDRTRVGDSVPCGIGWRDP